jgi:hypothetical protein
MPHSKLSKARSLGANRSLAELSSQGIRLQHTSGGSTERIPEHAPVDPSLSSDHHQVCLVQQRRAPRMSRKRNLLTAVGSPLHVHVSSSATTSMDGVPCLHDAPPAMLHTTSIEETALADLDPAAVHTASRFMMALEQNCNESSVMLHRCAAAIEQLSLRCMQAERSSAQALFALHAALCRLSNPSVGGAASVVGASMKLQASPANSPCQELLELQDASARSPQHHELLAKQGSLPHSSGQQLEKLQV